MLPPAGSMQMLTTRQLEAPRFHCVSLQPPRPERAGRLQPLRISCWRHAVTGHSWLNRLPASFVCPLSRWRPCAPRGRRDWGRHGHEQLGQVLLQEVHRALGRCVEPCVVLVLIIRAAALAISLCQVFRVVVLLGPCAGNARAARPLGGLAEGHRSTKSIMPPLSRSTPHEQDQSCLLRQQARRSGAHRRFSARDVPA